MSSQRWIGLLVVGFWLVMMGWLWHREMGVERLQLTAATVDPLARTESWLTIRLSAGQRVGQVHLKNQPEERQGVLGSRLDMAAEMQLQLLGKMTDLELGGQVWRPVDGRGVEFQLDVRSADYDFHLGGEVANGQMVATIRSAGETLPFELPISEDMLLGSGFGAALQFPVLEVGDEFLLDSFDPLTLSRGTARVRCLAEETLLLDGETVKTRRLRVRMGGIESMAWVDERGEVVRAETPFGLVIERAMGEQEPVPSGELAQVSEAAAGEDFLALTSIHPTGARPFRGATEMTVRLTGLDAVVDVPSDAGQIGMGDGVYRLLGTPPSAMNNTLDNAPFLRADPFVQSEHEVIRRRALAVVEGLDDPWQQALALHEWVFTGLDKEAVLSIPSALEVLEKRRGDCNEHTVLFTALARAVGLPTKIAIGLVWSDELDGFYYHAWPEVFVAGRWHKMDPTLGQETADATHLKLLEGGIETWPRLIPYLGRLEIEVLAVR